MVKVQVGWRGRSSERGWAAECTRSLGAAAYWVRTPL